MLTFERLTYLLTGMRGEPNQRSTRNRVCVGLIVNALLVAFALAFAGAAAGNAGATSAYWSFVVPAAAIAFLTYLAASIALFIRGYWQLAQYLAWAPLLLIVSVQTVQLGSLLLT